MQLFDGHVDNSALKEGKVVAVIGVAVRGQNLAAYANSSGIIAMCVRASCVFETDAPLRLVDVGWKSEEML